MLSIFGDESADETGQRVFAVAAVIGTDEAWRLAECAWLARTGGQIFHATDCESVFANDPDPSKHKANLALYADLANIIAESYLFGYGVALDLMAHRECFPGVLSDAGYYKCFTDVIRRTAETTVQFRETIEYTFDRRQQSEHNTGALYGLLVKMPEWQSNIYMRTKVSFDCNRNPRIQIADLVARETMKSLDNEIGPVKRSERKAMTALRNSGAFFFDVYGREYCASWHAQMPELMAKVGYTEPAYAEWLGSHGLVDNWTNRLRHLGCLQNKWTLS